jgi:hypothetical protein
MLLFVFVGVLGSVALLAGVYQWFVKPLRDLNAQIAAMEEKRKDLEDQWDLFQEEKEKLVKARTRSLPADPVDAGLEYMTVYLKEKVLNEKAVKGRFSVDSVQKTPPKEMKFASSIPGVKKVGHQVLTVNLSAEGDLAALVQVLDTLRRTPYEQRIVSMTIDRKNLAATSLLDPNPTLRINMTLEALIVANTKQKLRQRVDLEEASSKRRYADIASKNIFAGLIPYKTPPVGPTPTVDEGPKWRVYVPNYVRLVQIGPDPHEAFLRNIVYPKWPGKKTQEFRILAVPNSGAEHFKIDDQDTDFEFMRAKVLRVDARVIYFQVKNRVYEWELGQSLEDAMWEPPDDDGSKKSKHLSLDSLDELDLEADAQFTAAEAKRDEAGNAKKKSTQTPPKKGNFKGPTKKGTK